MIHFIYGKAGTGKSERIYKEIERVATGKHVFLLVPDREAVAAESRMAELRGAQNIDVITFGRLCNYIFRAYGDLCVDYRQTEQITASRLRLRIVGAPRGIQPGVCDFTAFGWCAH